MTLYDCQPRTRCTVTALTLPTALERRLEALGILEGTEIAVLRKKPRGAMVISVRGARFAIGYRIAESIEVRG